MERYTQIRSVFNPEGGSAVIMSEVCQNRTPEEIERLIAAMYPELRRLARRMMSRERPGHTLQPTALLHEALMRITSSPHSMNSEELFACAARQMRRTLVDYARRSIAKKRGSGLKRVPLDAARAPVEEGLEQSIWIDSQLNRLATIDRRAARVVELRFFGGCSNQEAARILHVSLATVERDWEFARLWLLSEMSGASQEVTG